MAPTTSYLVFGDIHVTPYSEFSEELEGGLTTYLAECLETAAWLASVIKKRRPDHLVFLGDWWETTGLIDTRSLKVGLEMLRLLEDAWAPAGEQMTFIVGNHDSYDARNRIHNLVAAMEFGRVIEVPTAEPRSKTSPGVLLVPWATDPAPVQAALQAHPQTLILSHLAVNGAVRFAGSGGLNREDGGLDPALFAGRVVVNGHYHRPDAFETLGAYIVNVGSPLGRTFHDVNSPPRGAVLMTVPLDPKKVKEHTVVERLVNPSYRSYEDLTVATLKPREWPRERLARTNARVFFRESEREKAEALAERCYHARLQLIPDPKPTVREDTIGPQRSALENLLAYLELQVPDLPDPDMYEALQEYAEGLVEQVPLARLPQPLEWVGLAAKDFMSFEKFSVWYAPGLVQVEGENHDDPTMGSNGSGKTVLAVEALYWLLSGKTLREQGVDKVIREGATGCWVEGKLKVGGDQYRLLRSRKDPEFGTALRIWKEGVPIECRLQEDSEAKLEEILRLSPTRLFQTVLLTADGKQERFSKLGPTDRLKVLEEMGGVTLYDDLRKLVKTDHDTKEREARDLQIQIETQQAGLRRAEEQVTRLRETLAAEEAAAAEKRAEYAAELDELQQEHQDKDRALQEVRRLIAEDQSTPMLRTKLQVATAAQDQARQALAVVKATWSRCKTEQGRFKVLGEGVECPECGQPISPAHIGQVLERLQREETEATAAVDQAHEALQQAEARAQALQELETVATGVARERERQAHTLSMEITHLVQKIEDRRALYEALGTQAAGLRAEIQRQEQETAELTSQIEGGLSAQTHAEAAQKLAAWWLAALGTTGLRSYVNEQSLKRVNAHLAEYSAYILGPRLGIISLSAVAQKATGGTANRIDIRLSGGRDFGMLSSGQKRRVDLAIQFALNDLAIESTGASINLLVVDEVLDPISEVGCAGVVDILRKKAERLQILLTTHNAYLKALQFDARWLVRLNKGGISTFHLGGMP